MKTARILLAAAALTGAAAPALAGDWKFLPVTEKATPRPLWPPLPAA